jgi:hypothetical protein
VRASTSRAVVAAVEAARVAYWDAIDAAATQARTLHVIPFCNRHGWKFIAGMGTWSFRDSAGEHHGTWEIDNEAAGRSFYGVRLWDALTAETIGGQDLGSLIEDYTPPGY